MKEHKYNLWGRLLLFVALVLCGTMARGQNGFNPTSPAEPSATYRLRTQVSPAEAGTSGGGGLYAEGRSVTVSATAAGTEWKFVNWTNSAGTAVSTSLSFTYKMTAAEETLTANFVQVATSQLTKQSKPSGLFTASTTTYKVGASVSMSCGTYTNYTFANWTDSKGNVLSDSRSFTYTVTEEDETLTANYKFTPGSPSEPSETKPKHKVYFTANPSSAGYFNQTSGMQVSEGTIYSVTASAYSNYVFTNWTNTEGQVLATSRTYSAVMGTADVTLRANFKFSPGSPADPGASSKARHTFYMPTVTAYIGETVLLPVYLENTGNVKDATFKLALPAGVTADTDDIRTTSRTSAYTPVASQSDGTLTVSLAGGTQISDHNGVVALVPVTISPQCAEDTCAVRFADCTLTMTDETTVSATSRPGTLIMTVPEEGELVAQFSVDRYLNRALFTNLTVGSAKSYTWNFGDGETSAEESPFHLYATPGTYLVSLKAKGIVKENTAEQTIIINSPTTWTASGDYTLDPDSLGVRNFTSVNEMVDVLSQCAMEGDPAVTIKASTYNYTADSAAVAALTKRLTAAKHRMTWKAGDTSFIFITAGGGQLQTVTALLENVDLENVRVLLNDVAIDMSSLPAERGQRVTEGTATQAVDLGAMVGWHSGVAISWQATVASGSKLRGYEASGSGNLPAMTIHNDGNAEEEVTYTILYKMTVSDTLRTFYTLDYTIRVTPAINADDLAALRVLHNALSGASWTKKWDTADETPRSASWPGVTFNADGRVTAISLNNNRLSGTVPASGFALPMLTSLSMNYNSITGDLAAFLADCTSLQTLTLDHCEFNALSGSLPSSITSLNLGYQRHNAELSGFALQEWYISTPMTGVELGSLIAYNHTAQDFTAHPRLRVYDTARNTTVAYLNHNGTDYTLSFSGDYTRESGEEFLVQPVEGAAAYCKLHASLSWRMGDANADNAVDVLDAQHTLNYILARHSGNFNYAAANTKADATINIQDLVCTINLFLDEDTGESSARRKMSAEEASDKAAYVYADGTDLMLDSREAVAAIDIVIEGITAGQVRSTLNTGKYQMIAKDVPSGVRVVIISPSGETLPTGSVRLLRMAQEAKPLSAEAADIEARRMTVGVGKDEVTGISSATESAEEGAAYDLSGRRSVKTHKGIRITNGKKTAL